MARMKIAQRFFAWYERHYVLNLSIATALFAVQIVHLCWLAMHVIALRLLGESYFPLSPFLQSLIVLVDYTEVPALISTTFLYLYELRKAFSWKAVFFLFFLNSQWLHLFWITDEFVLDQFQGRGSATVLPAWLAWVAILIDYLELPVIIDTCTTLVKEIRKGKGVDAFKVIKERD